MSVMCVPQVSERNTVTRSRSLSMKAPVSTKVAQALMSRKDGGVGMLDRVSLPKMNILQQPAPVPLAQAQMAAIASAAEEADAPALGLDGCNFGDGGVKAKQHSKAAGRKTAMAKAKATASLPESALEKAKIVAEKVATDAATLHNLAFRLQGVGLAEGCRKQLLEHAVFFQKQYPCCCSS